MSRWFEPPMKLQDAVNTLHRAINERYFSSTNKDWGNTPTPSPKKSVDSNVYDANVRSSFWGLYDRIKDLLLYAIVLKDDLWKWVTPCPYKRLDIEEVIAKILSSNGISPDVFLGIKERPGRLANSNFLNACYVLINHVRYSGGIDLVWNTVNIRHDTNGGDTEYRYNKIPRLV